MICDVLLVLSPSGGVGVCVGAGDPVVLTEREARALATRLRGVPAGRYYPLLLGGDSVHLDHARAQRLATTIEMFVSKARAA